MNVWNAISNFFKGLFKGTSKKPIEVNEPQKPIEIPAQPVVNQPTGEVPKAEMPTHVVQEEPKGPSDHATHPYWGYTLDEMLDVMDMCYDLVESYKIREDAGKNKSKSGWVEKFQKAVDGKSQGEPWCLAFQMFMHKDETIAELVKTLVDQNKISLQKAASFLKFVSLCDDNLKDTEHCMTLWRSVPDYAKIPFPGKPVRGALMLWNYHGTDSGHIERVKRVDEPSVGKCRTTGGNTGPESIVNREGDGLYAKVRTYNALSSTMMLKGFIVPWATRPKSVGLG